MMIHEMHLSRVLTPYKKDTNAIILQLANFSIPCMSPFLKIPYFLFCNLVLHDMNLKIRTAFLNSLHAHLYILIMMK